MYKGKDPCPGCQTPGTLKSRMSKTELCRTCAESLKIGKSFEALQEKEKYIQMVVRWYSLEFFNRDHGGQEVAAAFDNLFKTLSLNFGNGKSEYLTSPSATTADNRYEIRKDYYESLLLVVKALEVQQKDFRAKVDSYQKDLDRQFNEDKNRIYNEGIDKGRELLFSLNNGDITMQDFNKKITKY